MCALFGAHLWGLGRGETGFVHGKISFGIEMGTRGGCFGGFTPCGDLCGEGNGVPSKDNPGEGL